VQKFGKEIVEKRADNEQDEIHSSCLVVKEKRKEQNIYCAETVEIISANIY